MAKREKEDRITTNPRVTIAFYDDNLDYLRDICWMRQTSITEYINFLIKEDRAKNHEMLEAIKKERDRLLDKTNTEK